MTLFAAPDLHAAEAVAAVPALRTVTLTAFTRARRTMDLVSELSGKVMAVAADVGDTIGKDGVFVRLDTRFIDLDLERVAVEKDQLRSRIDYLDKETRRYRDLVAGHTAPQATLDDLEDQLAQARHNLRAKQVEEARLAEERSRKTVRAPAGWRVAARHVEPGEWIGAGQKVATLGDFATLLVPFALAPAEYHWLKAHDGRADTRFTLRLPEDGGTVAARIARVSPAFDETTRKINVDLEIADATVEHRGGLRVEWEMRTPDPSGAVLLPARCVEARYDEQWLTRANGERVKVVLLGQGPDGTVRVAAPEVRPGDRFVARED
ncbi:MAG: efflux RND transporter periplasmic adaptor subunit [Desulfovibrionaceae bacterium]